MVTHHDVPRLDRIAIGIDFSETARAAAEWAVRVLAPDAELLLVHALDVGTSASLGEPLPNVPDETRRDARVLAESRLRAVADALTRPGARLELPDGPAAPALLSVAEDWGADLVVVGPHGERTVARTAIGTTAERLIRTSPIPVLLATGTSARGVRRLLVPVDEVDLTAAMLEWTRVLAQRTGAEVTLVHVLGSVPEDDTARVEVWLAALAAELPGSVRVDLVTEAGSPGEHALAAARRASADLIVMGRRGRGRVLPGVLGSTASVVLRGAPCPVLVVVDPADAILADWTLEWSGGA